MVAMGGSRELRRRGKIPMVETQMPLLTELLAGSAVAVWMVVRFKSEGEFGQPNVEMPRVDEFVVVADVVVGVIRKRGEYAGDGIRRVALVLGPPSPRRI